MIPEDMRDIELVSVEIRGINGTLLFRRGNLEIWHSEPAELCAAILNREVALLERHGEELASANAAYWAEIDKLSGTLSAVNDLCTKWRERCQAAEARMAAMQNSAVHPDTIVPMWNKAGTEVIHVRYADIITGNHP